MLFYILPFTYSSSAQALWSFLLPQPLCHSAVEFYSAALSRNSFLSLCSTILHTLLPCATIFVIIFNLSVSFCSAMPLFPVTLNCHSALPLFPVTLPCHSALPLFPVTLPCHSALSLCCRIPPSYFILLFYSDSLLPWSSVPVLLCHSALSLCSVTLPCHSALSLCPVTLLCHSANLFMHLICWPISLCVLASL